MTPATALMARLGLGLLWSCTGLVSITYSRELSFQILASAGMNGIIADVCVYSGSVTDILIGAWLFLGWRMSTCCIVQIMLILIYTVLLSIIDPGYWLHPFGPLTKNIPVLILVYVLYQYEKNKDSVYR